MCLIVVVRILFLSSLTTSPKCPKYISTYVLFYTLAHLILNFLLCGGTCAPMIKSPCWNITGKKKLFFKLQNNRLSHSSFKRHKMNKIGNHFFTFLRLLLQSRCPEKMQVLWLIQACYSPTAISRLL